MRATAACPPHFSITIAAGVAIPSDIAILAKLSTPGSRLAQIAIGSSHWLLDWYAMNGKPKPADRIRAWLEESLASSGRTQTDLAKTLGVSPSAVTRILQGSRQMSIGELSAAIGFFEDTSVRMRALTELSGASDWITSIENKSDKDIFQVLLLESLYETLGRASEPQFKYISGRGAPNLDARLEVGSYDDVSGDIWIVPGLSTFGKYDKVPQIRWVRVLDDSLRGTLDVNNIAFINVSSPSITKSGIYAIEDTLGSIVFRRVEVRIKSEDQRDEVRIFADNPLYEEHIQSISSLRVIGPWVGVFRVAQG